MAECDSCGSDETYPYTCNRCGNTYCSDHRLPENHDCTGLGESSSSGATTTTAGETADGDSPGIAARLTDALPGGGAVGPLAGFQQNMTYVFLGAMWVTFLLQSVVTEFIGIDLTTTVFVLQSTHIEYVWTWVTSIFAHGGFYHIVVNSLVLYFFGPTVEKKIGSKKFTVLFLVTGAVAGLAQVGTALLFGGVSGVVGASGAIAAIMGVLTMLNPQLRIYLYFIIPMPLWVATLLFAGYSVFTSLSGGIAAGGVAQLAHLAGLFLGVAYGVKIKRDGVQIPESLEIGGNNGPGGPGRRF